MKREKMTFNKKRITLIILVILSFSLITPSIYAENESEVIITEKNSNSISSIKNEYIYPEKQINTIKSNIDPFIKDREYWAVLIGINNYPGDTIDLPYSRNEIYSFKNTLLDGGNWDESHIRVLTDDDADISGIFNAINWLALNAEDDDVSIFYFAGHGGRTPSNEYIVAPDGPISDIELDQKLDQIKGRLVVILDCCFSGGFIEELGEIGRVVLTACKKDELTYQVHSLSSGIFGYFINLSLKWLTKSAEVTFLFTWFFCVYYSTQLSQEFDGDYTIHPRFYDGTLGKIKIINRHFYFNKALFMFKIFNMSIENYESNIWNM
jgi:hypothetical protein